MTQYHPGYLEEKRVKPRLIPAPQIVAPEQITSSPYALDFPPRLAPQSLIAERLLTFLVGAILGAFGMYLSTGSPSAQRVQSVSPEQLVQPAAKESATSNSEQGDIALMKQILTGLVPMVESMEKRISASAAKPEQVSEDFNKPIVITTERASVRESGDKNSKVLLALAKGTVIFATRKESGWYRVSLPIGGEGYVSESVATIYVKKDVDVVGAGDSSAP